MRLLVSLISILSSESFLADAPLRLRLVIGVSVLECDASASDRIVDAGATGSLGNMEEWYYQYI